MKPLLLRHLSGENVGRFPVWLMRQAGRYLPSYREVRKDHSFWEMVTTPELAAEVSLQPVRQIGVDAVIFFSDILTLPYGFKIPVEMKESVGPVIPSPLSTRAEFERFAQFRPAEHTPFVGEALQKITKELSPETALLGFAGAPWTVSCYLVEGKANREFSRIKQWMHRDPADLAASLDRLGEATLAYLRFQHQSGAHAVQLFDTWLSEMPLPFFRQYYLPVLNKIFSALKADGIPAIFFSKGAHHLMPDFVKLEAQVLSCDALLPLTEVEARTQKRFSLQGNLDPMLLLGDTAIVRRETRQLVQAARQLSRPAILNLGHGVTPAATVENVKAFVEEAKALWI